MTDPTAPRKRSVTIAGHATSVSMEDAFWRRLSQFAAEQGLSVNALVAEVDRNRKTNLSSALRVWVLEECARRAGLPSSPTPVSSSGAGPSGGRAQPPLA